MSKYCSGVHRLLRLLPVLILFVFFIVLFYLILHYSFMFNPLHWIIPKKFIIHSLMLPFHFQNTDYHYFIQFTSLFLRRSLSPFYSSYEPVSAYISGNM